MPLKRLIAILLIAVLSAAGCSGPTTPEPEPSGPAAILSMDSVAVLGGRNVDVPIRLSYPDDPASRLDSLGGFNLLVRYDSPAMTLVNVTRGPGIAQWEYFTWRTYAVSNDPDSQAHGVLMVAIRDMNNGVSPDPPQYYPEGIIGTLTFWVTSDWDYLGTTSKVQFYSLKCGDNILSPQSGGQAFYIANSDFGPDSHDAVVDTMECLRRYAIEPVLEFRHGAVTIEEPPPITGDVNLNGIAFEFGDLVVFSQMYRGDFPDIDPELLVLMIANADCDGDGEPLTRADYDYLLNIVLDDVEPPDSL